MMSHAEANFADQAVCLIHRPYPLAGLDRSLRPKVFPLQSSQQRLCFLETDADIASCRGIDVHDNLHAHRSPPVIYAAPSQSSTGLHPAIETVSIDSG